MRKGQNLTEFGMIGGLIFGISILSLILFSDNLSGFFNKSSVTSVFNDNRNIKAESLTKYISGLNIKVGDTAFRSPVESVIAAKIEQNNYQQTSGSSGQVRETLDIISNYIEQLSLLLDNPNSGLNFSQISEIKANLQKYKEEISNYVALDNNQATTDNTKLAQALDISVNFSLNGETAKNFYESVTTILNTMSDSTQKNLLSEYSNSILNLGTSLDYKIDSRQLEQMGIKAESINNSEITEKAIEISGSLAQYTNINEDIATPASIKAKDKKDKKDKNTITENFNRAVELVLDWFYGTNKESKKEKTDVKPLTISALSSTELQNLIPKLNEIDNSIKDINKNLQDYSSNKKTAIIENNLHLQLKALTANKDYLKKIAPKDPILDQLNAFITQIQDALSIATKQKLELISKLKEQALTAEQAKTIEVYRNGTYQDILPNSYNNTALCKTLGGAVENNNCNTN